MNTEIVYADKGLRYKMIGVSFIVLAWILFADDLFSHFFLKETTTQTDPVFLMGQISRQISELMLFRFVSSSIVCVPVSVYMVWLGIRVWKHDSYPPPGMKMPFDTPIKHGTYAKGTAIISFIAAISALLMPAVCLWGWIMFKNI